MTGLDRRQFLAAGATAGLIAAAEQGVIAQGSARTRVIATEEAFAIPEYVQAYLRAIEGVDTPVSRYLRLIYNRPNSVAQLCDMDVRLAEMDRFGVDVHLLSLTAPGVQAFDAVQGAELATLSNDRLAAFIRAHPTRFAGLGAVAPQNIEHSVSEIGRIMGELRLGGVIINGHTNGEYLDDPKYRPILAALQQNRAPLYLHPTFPHETVLGPYSRYGMMGALWGFQSDTSTHAVRLILSGLFDDLPDLQIVLGHLGEGIPYWLGRLDNRYQTILRRGGLEPLGMRRLQRLPSTYFRTNFHMTTSGMFTAPPLDFCLRLFGPDRILFAIDYPFEESEEATRFINSFSMSAEVREKLLFRNAERLFNIAPAATRNRNA